MEKHSNATTDHNKIREWVEQRDGYPARVKGASENDPSKLRISFPAYHGGEQLEEITWDEFFGLFDEGELAFIFQDVSENGEISYFNRLVHKENVKVID